MVRVRRLLALAVIVSCGLAVAAAHARADPTFVNGDFSTSVPTNGTGGGWTSAGLYGPYGGWISGYFVLDSGGWNTSDPMISQELTGLTVGTVYTITWDYATHYHAGATPGAASFGVFLGTPAPSTALFLGENLTYTWVTASTTFTATSTSHTIYFAAELDGRTNGVGQTDISYLFSNVSLSSSSAVPEPASLALCLLGVAGLVVHRRRRK